MASWNAALATPAATAAAVPYTPNGLSALLRTQLGGGDESGAVSGRDLDIRDEKTRNKLQVSRFQALKRKREARGKADGSAPLAGAESQLTWAAFSAGASESTPQLTETRARFQTFVRAIQSVVGDERASSVLYHSAHVFFKALTALPNTTPAQQRALLERYFGRIPDVTFQQITTDVTALHAWRAKLQASSSSSSSSSSAGDAKAKPKAAAAGGAGGGKEFGTALRFVVPKAASAGATVSGELDDDDADLSEDEPEAPKAISLATTNAAALGSGGSGGNKKYDWQWLRRSCERFATFNDFGEQELGEEYFAQQILATLQAPGADEKVASQLEGLLGLSALDFVMELVAHRATLRNVKPVAAGSGGTKAQRAAEAKDRAMALALSKAESGPAAGGAAGGAAAAGGSGAPAAHMQNLIGVTIQTAGQKKAEQLRKKEARKMARQTVAPDGASNQKQDLDANRLEEQAKLLKDWARDGKMNGSALPTGAVRTQEKTYEQVMIPPAFPEALKADELVDVKTLDEFAQAAFEATGTKRLNTLQSKVFPCAYKSNENMLVCAPTGAGKTNVALLTVLHEIQQHIEHGVLQKDMFKIVYVAPMKALAQEVVAKFDKALGRLGIVCKELTGDTQLSKREIQETQIIVTTPEKWDVMTRKSGDGSLIAMVRLLIIDEVHLLHEDRGPVIEILVARTLRHVETSQQMCRIVGLSATLPNYMDVAHFLKVNPKTGLFFFDGRYRPVPLTQYYVGVKEKNPILRMKAMTDVAYRKALESVQKGHQVMVFVHARSDTHRTALAIAEAARADNCQHYFASCADNPGYDACKHKMATKCRNRELQELFTHGFGIHHAGMLRSDRALVEKAFADGFLNVLVCTATLAWGVNLPAHTVIIKGTQIYDAKRGGFVDVGMLDVMQIFGRAGRPQYDTTGEGILITAQDKLPHYLALLNHALPIESQFITALPDHLNAEIILGTVTNMREAMAWLDYTYLSIRMMRNPLAYGATYDELEMDLTLSERRRALITDAAKALMRCRMVRFDVASGNFFTTDVGRVASYYYIHHSSVEVYNRQLKPTMNDEEILHLLASSKEFEQLRSREEEQEELARLAKKACPIKIKGGLDSPTGKANVLLQVYISQALMDAPTLISDSHYITQSAGRIARALFEMVLKRGYSYLAHKLLEYAKMIDRRIWYFQTPLRQFSALKPDIIRKLEDSKAGAVESLLDMTADDIGTLIRQQKMGGQVLTYCRQIPYVELHATVQPVTRQVLKVTLLVRGDFKWNANYHGLVEPFWIWVEDQQNEHIYHTEYVLLARKTYEHPHKLEFTIPIFEPLPPQYFIRAVSDRWLGAETTIAVSFKHLMLPEHHPPHTPLLDLTPIPVTALHNRDAQRMYKFTHFNPVQTQVFHTCYHTPHNVLMGAPTGSGKTIVAELCMLRLFRDTPHAKVVYVAPMKALARERLEDWKSARSFGGCMGKRVVELTGDTTPDQRLLNDAHIIITTPEKWDGISRSWQSRGYVKAVGLIVIDEIHLLGQERGPVLEVIVSRARYIASHTQHPVRIVGLSTALANARDLADWLGIEGASAGSGLFNFEPLVRPVPLTIHISGFEGKHYCPRMATMNKPAYAAIMTYSPHHPALVFVSSRRQTRLTALDLVSFSAADGNPRKFLRNVTDAELELVVASVKDANLKHVLSFGIGLHHAGLVARDRAIVEDLFLNGKIQVLVCTATLAWGINLPARLVVIKGTEYFDAKLGRYVDFPVTDVLQMIGRAGRPQFDDKGTACVLVHAPKKNFYMKFLHSPFPVESSLVAQLPEHLNAEVVAGTIASLQDAVDYLSWTFFFRRLLVNPSYYSPGLTDTSEAGINTFLIALVRGCCKQLEEAGCLLLDDTDDSIEPLALGKIASFYYLKHATVRMFATRLTSAATLPQLLDVLCGAAEYDELPVRHNEDKLNEEMAPALRWPVDPLTFDSPHTKASILLQAHFLRLPLPISDYTTDTSSVLDQAIRICQAMVDVTAEAGWLTTTLRVMALTQMVVQARLLTDSTLLNLPHVNTPLLNALWAAGVETLADLLPLPAKTLHALAAKAGLADKQIADLQRVVATLPLIDVRLALSAVFDPNEYDDDDEEDGGEGEAADAKHSAAPKLPVVKSVGKGKTITCLAGAEVTVALDLTRVPHGIHAGPAGAGAGPASRKVWAPRFPKPKDEGWWAVVGSDGDGDELCALKRVVVRGTSRTRATLKFPAPDVAGTTRFVVYLMSDSYLGLDQQYTFTVTTTAHADDDGDDDDGGDVGVPATAAAAKAVASTATAAAGGAGDADADADDA